MCLCMYVFRDDVQQLQYTSLFLKEVMRMYPAAPQIARVATRPVTIDGVELPEGSIVEIHIYGLHHNPLVWDEPEVRGHFLLLFIYLLICVLASLDVHAPVWHGHFVYIS